MVVAELSLLIFPYSSCLHLVAAGRSECEDCIIQSACHAWSFDSYFLLPIFLGGVFNFVRNPTKIVLMFEEFFFRGKEWEEFFLSL